MRLIKHAILKFRSRWITRNKEEAPSFFDYTAEEKKKIINKAAREANKIQKELTDKYGNFPDERSMVKAYATK